MILTTSDYSTLTQKLNEWYNEAAKEKVESWIGKQIFDVSETDWQTYNYLILNGLAKFDQVAEGAQLPVASSVEGKHIIALFKSFLINGRTPIVKARTILNKQIKNFIVQLQRLSEKTMQIA